MDIVKTCDYRLKTNVLPLSDQLAKVVALRPVSYTHIWDNNSHTGFLAHELQAQFPECVMGSKDEMGLFGSAKYQSVGVGLSLIAGMVAATKELNDKVIALTTAHNDLKTAHDALRTEFNWHKTHTVALAHPLL